MTRSKIGYWIFAILASFVSVGMLAAGVGLVVRYELTHNPPAAIPRSAIPESSPEPHTNCAPAQTKTVPGHQLRIRPQDRYAFDLALQHFTHRHGGCSRRVARFVYRITLPQTPMRQILDLDRQNYDEWAVAAFSDTSSAPAHGATNRRQVELHLNHSAAGYAPDWMLTTGLFMAAFGLLASVLCLILCAEVANYRPTSAAAPATAM